jgi:hypothetical protein
MEEPKLNDFIIELNLFYEPVKIEILSQSLLVSWFSND